MTGILRPLVGVLVFPFLVAACGPPKPFGICAREPTEVAAPPKPTEPPPPPPPDPATGPEGLAQVGADWWEHTMRRAPRWATYLGDRRYDDRLEDASLAAHDAHLVATQALLDRATAVDPERLDDAQRVTRDVLLHSLREQLYRAACQQPLWAAVDQLYGPQVSLPQLPSFHTIRTDADLRTLLARYGAIPSLLAQLRANLQQGITAGWVAPREGAERTVAQLDRLAASAPEASVFVTQVTWPDALDETQRAAGTAELTAAVRDQVLPALATYRDFLRDTYVPAARTTPGIGSLPGGAGCYRALVRIHTGYDRTPEAIHRVGLEELDRLRAEMRTIAVAAGGTDDLSAFAAELRARPDQYVATADELVAVASTFVERATAKLPEVFGRLPKTPVEMREIEAFRAAEAPAAYYYPAPRDGSRPGYYYLNTHDLPSRPLYNQEALACHEAVPGHHLQIALAQEVGGLPDFQRHMRATAFTEGWALYAELLCDELGLYSSALTRFGALNYQAWRAVRLVVDTGIHAFGWSREQAITFMMTYTVLTEVEATAEVDRYIVWPGQALAYMLGRMTFDALRQDAEDRLGAGFDLRAFHDEVLRYGAVPLNTLRDVVERWVSAQTTTPIEPEAGTTEEAGDQ